jgi:hypothetical protein
MLKQAKKLAFIISGLRENGADAAYVESVKRVAINNNPDIADALRRQQINIGSPLGTIPPSSTSSDPPVCPKRIQFLTDGLSRGRLLPFGIVQKFL